MRKIILLLILILFCSCLITATQRRQNYVDSFPTTSPITKMRILEGKIAIGMTKAEVKASWGSPHSINRSVGSWGIHEQWVYHRQYLYFENNILTGWQD